MRGLGERVLGRLRSPLAVLAVGGLAAAATAGIGATGGGGGAGPDCAQAATGPPGSAAQGSGDVEARLACRAACIASTTRFRANTRGSGRGLRFGFVRGSEARRVRVAIFRVSAAGRVLRGRQVARFRPRGGPFRWSGRLRGRPAPDGNYVVRFRSGDDTRRVALVRRGGRFRTLPGYGNSRPCSALRALRLSSPLYGGRNRRALGIAYRISQPAPVQVVVTSGNRTVRRFAFRQRVPGTYRLRLRPRARAVRVTVSLRGPSTTVRTAAVARRLR